MTKRLELLDYGRFFAVIIVVAFHYSFNGIANGKISSIDYIPSVIELTKYGYLGVEFFFLISGYVIFFSAKNREASSFAESRAIRLYPAYWFAVLFTSFFALQWGGELMSVSPTQIIVNLSMVQSVLGVGHVDGVYWTLVYEIKFYFAVLLLLFFGFQKYLSSIFIYWPILFCVAIVFDLESIIYMGNYYYYFSAGALFAVLADKFDWRAVLSLLVVYALCVNYSVGNVGYLAERTGAKYSSVVVFLIITSFFILFLYQNTKSGRSLSLPMSRMAGALTYPIYLIHAHFGYMLLSRFATEENKISVYALTVLIVLVVAIVMHLVIERRLHFVWKFVFNHIVRWPLKLLQEMLRKIRFP